MNNPVGWFEIYIQEMERAKAFYQAVFDVELTRLESPPGLEMWAFPMQPDSYGAPGALVKMEGCGSGDQATTAFWSISAVPIVPCRRQKPSRLVAKFTRKKWPSGNTDLSRWSSTRKGR